MYIREGLQKIEYDKNEDNFLVYFNNPQMREQFEKGFNAKTGQFVDMFAEGIIDPKKVTRAAIQNATSVVGMILTTECMVVDKPKIDEKTLEKQMLMG